jgi:hypothetical protein
MVMDQFGMVGLLTFIRAAETDSNLVALAPGIDLTTLGLNLNSPGSVTVKCRLLRILRAGVEISIIAAIAKT